jgi:hypothetical protein
MAPIPPLVIVIPKIGGRAMGSCYKLCMFPTWYNLMTWAPLWDNFQGIIINDILQRHLIISQFDIATLWNQCQENRNMHLILTRWKLILGLRYGIWYLNPKPNFPHYTSSVICAIGPSVNPIQNSLNMWTLFCNIYMYWFFEEPNMKKEIMFELNGKPSKCYPHILNWFELILIFSGRNHLKKQSISPTFWIQILPNRFH